jgi:UDP-N-acetylglucosamine acyltransferase
VVEKSVYLAGGVEVGPFCVLRGDVKVGAGTKLISHVCLEGPCEVGQNNTIYPGACLGFAPQDYKFTPGVTPTAGVRVGDNNLIREGVTIHAATKTAHPTTVGSRCMLMVNSHLGHDTVIGNDVILANGALLAGHVRVSNNVMLSGNTAIHQFCRVGRFAFISGGTVSAMDVPPFCIVGLRNMVTGLNRVGMRRNGVPREDIEAIDRAYRMVLIPRLPRDEMIATLTDLAAQSAYVKELRDFIAEKTGKAMCRARQGVEDETLS